MPAAWNFHSMNFTIHSSALWVTYSHVVTVHISTNSWSMQKFANVQTFLLIPSLYNNITHCDVVVHFVMLLYMCITDRKVVVVGINCKWSHNWYKLKIAKQNVCRMQDTRRGYVSWCYGGAKHTWVDCSCITVSLGSPGCQIWAYFWLYCNSTLCTCLFPVPQAPPPNLPTALRRWWMWVSW